MLALDDDGRVLLVRHADSGAWGLVGGAIDVDGRPVEAAIRETEEEAGLRVQVGGIKAVLGGPEFRVTYPNGDETAYASVVYAARVVGGTEAPDFEETTETGWFGPAELPELDLNPFAWATFHKLGWLRALSG